MKNLKSFLAISLTLAIIVGSLVFSTGVSAATESELENVLAGETPIVYAVFNAGSTTNAYQEAYYDASNFKMCYDAFADNGEGRINFWKPYMAKLTDENADTNQTIKPMNSGKDIGIIYEIAQADIKSIEIDIANGSTGDVRVYAANSTASLYSTLIDTIPATSTSVTRTVNTTDTRYIAFFFNNPNLVVNEIKLNGNFEGKKSESPDVLAQEQIPITYVAHNPLGTIAYRNIYDQGLNNHPNSGYDKLKNYNYNNDRIAYWQPYTKLLTDNDTSTWLRAKPENASDNMVIVFELAELMKIDGFKFNFYEEHAVVKLGVKKFKVYASDNAATLYNAENMISNVSTYDDEYLNDITVNKLAKYIAIQCYENFCISEITFNGEALGEDIITGKTPIVYTTTEAGELYNSMHELTCDGQTNGLMGIDLPNGRGVDRVETWKTHLSRFTDGATNNSSFLGVRFDSHNTDGIKLTYEIPASKLTAFSINVRTADVGKKTTGGIKVYAANSYADLEKESSVVATVPATTGSVISAIDPGELADAKYVMFAFTTPMIHIYELDLYGTQPYDVNEDNDVTIRDLVALYNIIKEGDSWDQCDMADLRESLLK